MAEGGILPGIDEARARRGAARAAAVTLAASGHDLSSDAAGKLEADLARDPQDLNARITLLGFYFMRQFRSSEAKQRRAEHVLWIIRSHPSAAIASTPYVRLEPDEQAFVAARELWLSHARSPDASREVIENAAVFLSALDPDLAEQFWKSREQYAYLADGGDVDRPEM